MCPGLRTTMKGRSLTRLDTTETLELISDGH